MQTIPEVVSERAKHMYLCIIRNYDLPSFSLMGIGPNWWSLLHGCEDVPCREADVNERECRGRCILQPTQAVPALFPCSSEAKGSDFAPPSFADKTANQRLVVSPLPHARRLAVIVCLPCPSIRFMRQTKPDPQSTPLRVQGTFPHLRPSQGSSTRFARPPHSSAGSWEWNIGTADDSTQATNTRTMEW